MTNAQSKVYVRRENDQRANQTLQFSLLDSDFNIIRKDRRHVADRRKANLKLIWQENQPIRNTSELSLRIGEKSYFFDNNSLEKFSQGRSLHVDVRIVTRFVSKHHANISYLDGEFVLQDISLNGTFMETEELGKIRLQGQKVYLFGEGKVSLGEPLGREDQQIIYFHCQQFSIRYSSLL